MPGWQTTSFILLPQAIRNVIPAIVGQFIGLFKDTSLVYIIGMLDIIEIGRTIHRRPPGIPGFNAKEVFIFLAAGLLDLHLWTMSYVSQRTWNKQLGVGVR